MGDKDGPLNESADNILIPLSGQMRWQGGGYDSRDVGIRLVGMLLSVSPVVIHRVNVLAEIHHGIKYNGINVTTTGTACGRFRLIGPIAVSPAV
ncbi:unnamed protein product [Protopolystoma xenopodis]|uniref:Uncharacterized protein n=1 Tax=Protopolystoma xenopodis TaxID=117903 RepID=A0A3S4ZER3_9PLAT|nr:unnamed protein product [Protopolystoma xenopodis]